MIVARRLKLKQVLYYSWKGMLYFTILSILIYIAHRLFNMDLLKIPFTAIATLSTALAIFLGFKSNNAYDRWWEARKIWGLMVNYSRAWTRQILIMVYSADLTLNDEVKQFHKKVVYRHLAFINALRVFLRKKNSYNDFGIEELYEDINRYDDIKKFISPEEYLEVMTKNNPPNYLLQLQGESIQKAKLKGWITDYQFIKLEETLVEFTNIQGMSERIKNTPFPRQFSYFSRVFVFIHGTLLPFAFITELGWLNIPLSITINFVFFALDLIGERTEDPFENRLEDTPLNALCITIEQNLREQLLEKELPSSYKPLEGVVL